MIDHAGKTVLVIVGGGAIHGLDPANGRILWSYPHDPGNDLNCSTPLWGSDDVLFVSSAYKAGSRALRLAQAEGRTVPQQMWFTRRTRFMFLGAVRVGDVIYGTSGDFGPAFLTALDIRTGKALWRKRGFPRASLLYAEGKAIILDEDGELAIARLSPQGAEVLARTKVFETTSWSAPALVGTTLYARDREKIVAIDLGAP